MTTSNLCGHDGGRGIGAGHVCHCGRAAGHPLDTPRPHGCSCGAMWADQPEPIAPPQVRVWPFARSTRVPAAVTDRQVRAIANKVAAFEEAHGDPEGLWGVYTDLRDHWSGQRITGQDVTVLLVCDDVLGQVEADVYGNGREWWQAAIWTPLHGDHDDFEDEVCDAER